MQTLFILTCSGILFGMFFGFALCWLRTQKNKHGKFRKEPYFFALIAILIILPAFNINPNFTFVNKIYFILFMGLMGFIIGLCWISLFDYAKTGAKIGNYELKHLMIGMIVFFTLKFILNSIINLIVGETWVGKLFSLLFSAFIAGEVIKDLTKRKISPKKQHEK